MFARSRQDAIAIDGRGIVTVGVEQRRRRHGVDQPWNPAGQPVQQIQRIVRERIALPSCHMDAVADIPRCLFGLKRKQSVADPDTLAKRIVLRAFELILEFGLSDENDGKEILVIELKVREKSYFIEGGLSRNELCFVDDQCGMPVFFVQFIEPVVNSIEQRQSCPAGLEVQAGGNRSQQLGGRQPGIDDQNDRPRVAQAVDESARDGGLAAADLAREQSELIFFDGILQTGQRFTMLARFIEKGRVRGFPERLFSQSEELAEQISPPDDGSMSFASQAPGRTQS